MVDAVRGNGDAVGMTPGVNADGTGAAQGVKQSPAGALSAPTLQFASAADTLAPAHAAERAPGAPVPLPTPAADALSASRVQQAVASIVQSNTGEAVAEADITKMLLLMHELSLSLRSSAQKQRAASQEANLVTQQSSIGAMRQAALQRFIGSVVEGAAQVGMGAFSMLNASKTATAAAAADEAKLNYVNAKTLSKGVDTLGAGAGEALPTFGPALPTAVEVQELKGVAKAVAREAERVAGVDDSIQKMGASVSKTASSAAGFAADESGVAQRRHELDASRHDMAANAAAEIANTMRERAAETLNALRAMQQSLNDASSAINRNL